MTHPVSPPSTVERRDLEETLRRGAITMQGVAPGVWRAEVRGQTVPFPLWVSDEGELVRFVISPMLTGPKEPERIPILHERLLRLNMSVRMARFAVTPDGEVELMTELVAAHLDAAEVRDCIRGLLYYADRYYGTLAVICRTPSRISRPPSRPPSAPPPATR